MKCSVEGCQNPVMWVVEGKDYYCTYHYLMKFGSDSAKKAVQLMAGPSEYKNSSSNREYKTLPAYYKFDEEDQGIVEHLISVYGIVDLGGDVAHKGMFTKTISERGKKVRVVDNHQIKSISNVVGKPIEFREVDRHQLPPEVLRDYPDATGGLMVKTQFLMDTPEGKGAYVRLKEGAIDEFSFAYDALDFDFENAGPGKKVRNLRTVRLWEYGPVIFGMNQAAVSVSAKSEEGGNPWKIFKEGDEYCIYKVNEDGDKTGKTLGCHATRDEAQEQLQALYANEKGIHLEVIPDSALKLGDLRLLEGQGIELVADESLVKMDFDAALWSFEQVTKWYDRVGHKAVGAYQRAQVISNAFNKLYGWWREPYVEDEPIYSIYDIYEDYVIAYDQDSMLYYKVEFSVGEDGVVAFESQDVWERGTLEFVAQPSPETEVDTAELESKIIDLEIMFAQAYGEAGPE